PELERVHDTYPQVEIFTVTIDTAADSVEDMISYSRDHGISWNVARDIYGIGSSKFQVTGTPTTVLIDKDFNVVRQQSGVLTFETMKQWIDDNL
ncbi:MAG: TlpA family protein disulfide reductase, partial [Candidatus Hodarchaeales archaeon]